MGTARGHWPVGGCAARFSSAPGSGFCRAGNVESVDEPEPDPPKPFSADSGGDPGLVDTSIGNEGVDINWTKIVKKFEGFEDPLAEVIRLLPDCPPGSGKSYLKYLQQNIELNVPRLRLFSEVLASSPDFFSDCREALFELLNKLPPAHESVRKMCCDIISESEDDSEHDLLYEIKTDAEYREVLTKPLTAPAFSFLTSYISKKVKMGLVPNEEVVDLFTKVIEEDYVPPLELLIKLVFILQDIQDKTHRWIVSEHNVRYWRKEKDDCLKCPNCHNKLETYVSTTEDTEKLKSQLLEAFVFNESLLCTTKLDEWNQFLKFLNGTKYNTVIDGLNLYFSRRHQLFSVINHLLENGLKPLMLLKKHVEMPLITALKKKVPVFILNNESNDDLLFVYAALKRNCYILTRDQLRFLEAVSWRHKNLMKKWRTSHSLVFEKKHVKFPSGVKIGLYGVHSMDKTLFRYHWVWFNLKDPMFVLCMSRSVR